MKVRPSLEDNPQDTASDAVLDANRSRYGVRDLDRFWFLAQRLGSRDLKGAAHRQTEPSVIIRTHQVWERAVHRRIGPCAVYMFCHHTAAVCRIPAWFCWICWTLLCSFKTALNLRGVFGFVIDLNVLCGCRSVLSFIHVLSNEDRSDSVFWIFILSFLFLLSALVPPQLQSWRFAAVNSRRPALTVSACQFVCVPSCFHEDQTSV